jgi:hypothetical protein
MRRVQNAYVQSSYTIKKYIKHIKKSLEIGPALDYIFVDKCAQ